jgi:hypothetical protein
MQKLGLRFEMMSNPEVRVEQIKILTLFALRANVLTSLERIQWFERDAGFAWGFWSHRYNLYSKTTPHDGFQIMKVRLKLLITRDDFWGPFCLIPGGL